MRVPLSGIVRRAVRDEDGFSLTELLVVLVIIGVLVALLALPRFSAVTTRAKTTEARIMLRQAHALQQAYRFEHDAWATDLRDAGFEHPLLLPEGGTAYYRIAVERADGAELVLTATSVVDFDHDGVFNVWEADASGAVRERVAD